MPESGWVSTRQEPGPRRAAICCSDIALGESYTVCSQCVDVGRWDLLVAIATCLSPALIIGLEDQQVGFGRLLSLSNLKVNANQACCNRAAKCCEWKTHFGAPCAGNANTRGQYIRSSESISKAESNRDSCSCLTPYPGVIPGDRPIGFFHPEIWWFLSPLES